MFIDSHAHLEYSLLNKEEIIANMKEDKLEKIVTIGTDVESSKQTIDTAEKNKDVYAVIGIHPEFANKFSENDLNEIYKLAQNEKVVAIGEIGLDYHYCLDNKEKQKDLFIKQIKIAKKHNLPIVIHTRDALEDTYQILKEYEKDIVKPSVMHCYSGGREYMQKFLDLGFYLSFAGNITYKKSDRSFIKDIPLDKILIETDCPFLSPEPLRGRTNVPANVVYTAEKLADERQMNLNDFAKQTTKNTYRVFYKMKKEN